MHTYKGYSTPEGNRVFQVGFFLNCDEFYCLFETIDEATARKEVSYLNGGVKYKGGY